MGIAEKALTVTTAVPRIILGQIVDGSKPYDDSIANPRQFPPQDAKALVIAADRTGIVPRYCFVESGERISRSLARRVGDIAYLRGNADIRARIAPALTELCRGDELKIIAYLGSAAPSAFFDIESFAEKRKGPLVILLDHRYSGDLAKRLAQQHDTVTISSNTARTLKPSPHFLPMVVSAWASGESLHDAFTSASLEYHHHSLEYRINESPSLLLQAADSVFHFSKATKLLYANGIDVSALYLKEKKNA